MTIGELRQLLSSFHDSTKVIMSKDPEGNHFWNVMGVAVHRVEDIDTDIQIPHSDVVVIWPGW